MGNPVADLVTSQPQPLDSAELTDWYAPRARLRHNIRPVVGSEHWTRTGPPHDGTSETSQLLGLARLLPLKCRILPLGGGVKS